MNKADISTQLDKLEFFKYAEAEKVQELKNNLLENIIEKRAFFFPPEKNSRKLDGRLFDFDFEELMEGGALQSFEEMKPSFEKAGLIIEAYSQVFNTDVQDGVPVYLFTLNGRTCNLSRFPKIPFLLQGIVAKRYISFINKELSRQKIKERIFMMNDKASDSELAFLTKEQALYITSLDIDPGDKPYRFNTLTLFRGLFEIARIILKALFGKKTIQS